MTSNLVRRVYEHREGLIKGFTKRYGLKMLVWFELHEDVNEAIKREKNIQAWKRQWKMDLIEKENPDWKDLYKEIAGCQPTLA